MSIGKIPADRMQLDLRRLIDLYLEKGWEIESRDPTIVITRGHLVKHMSNGVLKDGWTTTNQDAKKG